MRLISSAVTLLFVATAAAAFESPSVSYNYGPPIWESTKGRDDGSPATSAGQPEQSFTILPIDSGTPTIDTSEYILTSSGGESVATPSASSVSPSSSLGSSSAASEVTMSSSVSLSSSAAPAPGSSSGSGSPSASTSGTSSPAPGGSGTQLSPILGTVACSVGMAFWI